MRWMPIRRHVGFSGDHNRAHLRTRVAKEADDDHFGDIEKRYLRHGRTVDESADRV